MPDCCSVTTRYDNRILELHVKLERVEEYTHYGRGMNPAKDRHIVLLSTSIERQSVSCCDKKKLSSQCITLVHTCRQEIKTFYTQTLDGPKGPEILIYAVTLMNNKTSSGIRES